MSGNKVLSILNWKPPRSVTDVQIRIGFANFYLGFIEKFTKVYKLITECYNPLSSGLYLQQVTDSFLAITSSRH